MAPASERPPAADAGRFAPAAGRRPVVLVALVLLPAGASAHGGPLAGDGGSVALWLLQGLYLLSWFGYAFGAVLHRPTPWRRAGFHTAMLVAGLALFGPLDDLALASTAWHMAQHMLLMVVVAPLLAMSRPGPQWRALLGPLRHAPGPRALGTTRRAGLAVAAALRRLLLRAARVLVRASRRPMACAMLHALAIWAWHAPVLYMAAVMDTTLHVLEHLSFLLTGVLFWWSVLQPGRQGAPQAALALLFTLMHTGLLGAALTFAPELLYWKESRELWDQQVAGLLMWVPGGMVYVLAAVWSTAAWLARQDARPAPLQPAPGVGLVPQSLVVPADAVPDRPSLQ